ncbi:zinc finger protein 91-like [Cylas formicarius]|uniref:zinc finger protein 91-like n=1 Tax=Cylas formicarius TaxID=197179 RepID=UPI002958818E|nr:zinc finger protein 91-like [Cylas formicarius]
MQCSISGFECACGTSYPDYHTLSSHHQRECQKILNIFKCLIPTRGATFPQYCRPSDPASKRFTPHVVFADVATRKIRLETRFVTVFPCPKCEKVYHHKKTLNRHIRQECGVEPELKCPHCPYRARRVYVLQNHIKGHLLYNCKAGSPSPFRRPASPVDLRAVAVIHIVLGRFFGRVHRCYKCGREYNRNHNLTRHLKVECGQKPQFKCPFCPDQFKYKHVLKRHLLTHTSKFNQIHKCSTCGKEYNHQPNLYRHIKYECNKVRYFRCPYCNYAGFQKSHLKTHILRRHEELFYTFDKLFGAPQKSNDDDQPQLDQQFVPLSAPPLPATKKPKNPTKRFLCHCGKAFMRRQSLNSHTNFVCGKMKQHYCGMCKKFFWALHQLKEHQKICKKTCHGEMSNATVEGVRYKQKGIHKLFTKFSKKKKRCYLEKRYVGRQILTRFILPNLIWRHNIELHREVCVTLAFNFLIVEISKPNYSGNEDAVLSTVRTTPRTKPERFLAKKFKCSVCQKAYFVLSSLRRHERFECQKDKQFSCPYCLKKYIHKHHVTEHIPKCTSSVSARQNSDFFSRESFE